MKFHSQKKKNYCNSVSAHPHTSHTFAFVITQLDNIKSFNIADLLRRRERFVLFSENVKLFWTHQRRGGEKLSKHRNREWNFLDDRRRSTIDKKWVIKYSLIWFHSSLYFSRSREIHNPSPECAECENVIRRNLYSISLNRISFSWL